MNEPVRLKRSLQESLNDAWVSCWMHTVRHPNLKRLPPHLWEPLRRKLQRIYRDATGEDMATLSVSDEARPSKHEVEP